MRKKYQESKPGTLKTAYSHCDADVPYMTYLNVVTKFIEFTAKQILSGRLVKLPEGCGNMIIEGKKIVVRFDEDGNIKNLAPDWVNTKKLWDSNPQAKAEKKLLYHFNEHSAGIRYRLNWEKKLINIPNKILYGFILSRSNKRTIWKAVKEGTEYKLNNFNRTNEIHHN